MLQSREQREIKKLL